MAEIIDFKVPREIAFEDYEIVCREIDDAIREIALVDPEMAAYINEHLVRDPVNFTLMWKEDKPKKEL